MTDDRTPNSLVSTGHRINAATLAKMSTEALCRYYCELRTFQNIYDEEGKAVKELLETRTDMPNEFTHPAGGYGSIIMKKARASYIVVLDIVMKIIGKERALRIAKITKTDLEKNVTKDEMKKLSDAGAVITDGGSGKTVTFEKD